MTMLAIGGGAARSSRRKAPRLTRGLTVLATLSFALLLLRLKWRSKF
jgi:hypothetical protein